MGSLLVSTLLAGTISAAFGLTIMDDDLKDVQPYPVELWQRWHSRSDGEEQNLQ
jgi:hypothetical protein